MMLWNRLPKLRIIFWLLQVSCVVLLWNFLPTHLTSGLLLLLVIISGVMLSFRLFELPIFTNVALILTLAHFWTGDGRIVPVIGSTMILTGVVLTGLIADSFDSQQLLPATGRIQLREFLNLIERENLRAWCVIGLFTAEISALSDFWPVSYWQKSLLSTIIFYFVWQLWRIIGTNRRSLLAHFIFVGLAVTVVVVNIVWTTWPGLKTF